MIGGFSKMTGLLKRLLAGQAAPVASKDAVPGAGPEELSARASARTGPADPATLVEPPVPSEPPVPTEPPVPR